ncbi:type I-C CRISPR-associated protein Cas8c/Csd1, partial [Novosphingobium sp. 18050]|uniref:type I-C CRISPR-associated protein Cas8c/Csd1 n=1 Tax=Novosphingobium sp. 18050 TaxID=2681398 RepID=UPI00190F2999
IAQPGYSQENISYEIVLAPDGSVVAVNDIRNTAGKKPLPKVIAVPASFKRPGIGSRSFFLWDKSSYVLGFGEAKAAQDHASFRELHLSAMPNLDDPALIALQSFIKAWQPESLPSHALFAPHAEGLVGANIVFRLDGE